MGRRMNSPGRASVSTAMHARSIARSLAALAAVTFLVVAVAACGSDDSKASSSTTAKSNDAATTVTAQGTAFTNPNLTVKAGADVYFSNKDSFDHTLTADDGSFDTGHVKGGATDEFKAPAAGTYPFHCAIHSTMKGVLTVQ
jgi:plastocyanin